jgi:hypothetical protein
MKFLFIGLLTLTALGCTDTTPEVRYLVDPSLLKVSDKTYAEANVAAATSVTATSGDYTAKLMVHDGTKTTQATTPDNDYVMVIRKVSY